MQLPKDGGGWEATAGPTPIHKSDHQGEAPSLPPPALHSGQNNQLGPCHPHLVSFLTRASLGSRSLGDPVTTENNATFSGNRPCPRLQGRIRDSHVTAPCPLPHSHAGPGGLGGLQILVGPGGTKEQNPAPLAGERSGLRQGMGAEQRQGCGGALQAAGLLSLVCLAAPSLA